MQKLSMITKIIKGISLFTETDGESGIVGISTYWDDADNVCVLSVKGRRGGY